MDITFTHKKYMEARYKDKVRKHNNTQQAKKGKVSYEGTYPIVFERIYQFIQNR